MFTWQGLWDEPISGGRDRWNHGEFLACVASRRVMANEAILKHGFIMFYFFVSPATVIPAHSDGFCSEQ